MPTAIRAIYENGVFRPVQPVDLPERCEVEVDIRTVNRKSPHANVDEGDCKLPRTGNRKLPRR
jgi:predicted DNA-binding antitoxin AbrB/MazE fold protein